MSSFPGFNKSEVSLVSARACKGSRVYNENRRKNVPNALLVVSNGLERLFFSPALWLKTKLKMRNWPHAGDERVSISGLRGAKGQL